MIRDTGILVDELLDWIAAGKGEAQIIHDHPCLEHADFQETYRYASLRLCAEELAGRLREARSEANPKLNGPDMKVTSEQIRPEERKP